MWIRGKKDEYASNSSFGKPQEKEVFGKKNAKMKFLDRNDFIAKKREAVCV
jgi:hypothetical protein